MKNSNLKIIFSLTCFFLLSGCDKKFNKIYILNQCEANKLFLDPIMREGIAFCEEDIKNADIQLREVDSWSPTDFVKEARLEELTGIHIRYISFYSIGNRFVGMVMRINPNLILYKGKPINNNITIAGTKYHVNECTDNFAFYSK